MRNVVILRDDKDSSIVIMNRTNNIINIEEGI